jgi:hypothetical protein
MALPVDPIGLIPVVGDLVVGIVNLAKKITDKVKEVKVNQRRCTTLSERINRTVAHLEAPGFHKTITTLGGALKNTLERFESFLEDCLQYISLFVDMWWIKKFIYTRQHREQFEFYNEQLSYFVHELTMGINIKNSINKQQDEQDRDADLRDLQSVIAHQKQKDMMQHGHRINRMGQFVSNGVDHLRPHDSQKSRSHSRMRSSSSVIMPRLPSLLPMPRSPGSLLMPRSAGTSPMLRSGSPFPRRDNHHIHARETGKNLMMNHDMVRRHVRV